MGQQQGKPAEGRGDAGGPREGGSLAEGDSQGAGSSAARSFPGQPATPPGHAMPLGPSAPFGARAGAPQPIAGAGSGASSSGQGVFIPGRRPSEAEYYGKFSGFAGGTFPGSPLVYGPQPMMEPLADWPTRPSYNLARTQDGVSPTQEFHGVAGWPTQHSLVPTVLAWSHGAAQTVEVEGSWDNWTSRLALLKSGKDYTIVKLLMPGVYQYKFIVDGGWKYAPDQPAIYDDMGNVNNVIEVQEYVPENIQGLSSFEQPPSPPSSYQEGAFLPEEFDRDPPLMPKQLNLTLLNVPMFVEAPAVLPRPQHVILNHSYEEKSHDKEEARVLGLTYRYKSKYVTTVVYKPRQTQITASPK